jgi:methylated-DNA-[protein]-cysteine S-methyltransferase
MDIYHLQTPVGTLAIEGSAFGLQKATFCEENISSEPIIPSSLQNVVRQFEEYFLGKRKDFDIKLDLQGTDFQKLVWSNLLQIPYGETTSYLALSKKIGNVKAIRAVGLANGKNPVGIVVPCHRVIGSKGDLVGYAGGLWRKRWLLSLENPTQSLFELS